MGIGALPNFVRPFHHYALRTSHYALKNQHVKPIKKPPPTKGRDARVTTQIYFPVTRKNSIGTNIP